ncbi:MAG: hypothetical protein WAZ14_03410 [Patescibacteria group bacterium]
MTLDTLDQLKVAVRGVLMNAPNVNTARNWIRALPGPPLSSLPEGAPAPRGMYFDLVGEITVRFNEDGSREAVFTMITEPDDPSPQLISVRWEPIPGFLTPEQTIVVREALFGR